MNLYNDLLKDRFPESSPSEITYTAKEIRTHILNNIYEFRKRDGSLILKEFIDTPLLESKNYELFNNGVSFETNYLIVNNSYNLDDIIDATNDDAHILALDLLDPENLSVSNWDNKLNNLLQSSIADRVYKIYFENSLQTLKRFKNMQASKDQIIDYIAAFNVPYKSDSFWKEPLKIISKNYWDKFSFVLVINDYELYDSINTEYLNYIKNDLFDNGYFDEIVIKINYFYWSDNFAKIINWVRNDLKSAMVSYRLSTIPENDNKHRYYSESEASAFNDTLRYNTLDEEIEMYRTRLPILVDKILENTQTTGFELLYGYIGNEGDELVTPDFDNLTLDEYKSQACQYLNSIYNKHHETIQKTFEENGRQVEYICIKK